MLSCGRAMRVRRHLKRMEKQMEREERRALRLAEGRPKRHLLRKLLGGMAGLTLAALIAGWFVFDVPSWQRLDLNKITNLQQTGAVYDRYDQPVSALKGSQDRKVIALSTLPDTVKNAFLAAEDLRFYKHFGFDPVRILGAVFANLRSGGYSEGASTITQQLIKLTHLSSEKTLARKLEEVWLAVQLEAACTKDEILEMYLNMCILAGAHTASSGRRRITLASALPSSARRKPPRWPPSSRRRPLTRRISIPRSTKAAAAIS